MVAREPSVAAAAGCVDKIAAWRREYVSSDDGDRCVTHQEHHNDDGYYHKWALNVWKHPSTCALKKEVGLVRLYGIKLQLLISQTNAGMGKKVVGLSSRYRSYIGQDYTGLLYSIVIQLTNLTIRDPDHNTPISSFLN